MNTKFFLFALVFSIVFVSNTPGLQYDFELRKVYDISHVPTLHYSHTIRNNLVESQLYVPAYSYVTLNYPNTAYKPFAHEYNVARSLGARNTYYEIR